MRKHDRGTWLMAAGLVALSAALYALNLIVFRDLRNIGFYTLLDLGFIPLEVLIVGLFINRLLARRERRSRLDKLNMVIGAFHSEVGDRLIGTLAEFDTEHERLRPHLVFRQDWRDHDWDEAVEAVSTFDFRIDAGSADLVALRDFLASRRGFLLRLLENPNLLEHESFTELLWAVFHLTEELEMRHDLAHLTRSDREHLSGDIRRAFALLLHEWLEYLRHLQRSYPYLFSLKVRTDPFDPKARVELD